MPNLIFLDTETTGNDPAKDRLVQLCYKIGDQIVSEYFKPPFPIPVKAMSITHITNKIVDDKPTFPDSDTAKTLQTILTDHILVAHNAPFDIAILKNEGITTHQFIDTLKVAKHLDQDFQIPEYNLQYLRYFHELEIEANAHDAKGDVLVLEGVFNKLLEKLKGSGQTTDQAIQTMIELSTKPLLLRMFNFGKYRGQNIADVSTQDKGYLLWLLNEKLLKNDPTDEDWIYTLQHYTK